MAQPPWLRIEGARQNNLKNVSRRHPPRPGHRDHGRLGIGQVLPRLRHPLRRGPVALHRVALHLRPHVPRAARPARRRPHRAHPARHRARAEEPGAHRALHGGHRHRAARLPAPALREDRPRPLPHLRGGGAERLRGRRWPTTLLRDHPGARALVCFPLPASAAAIPRALARHARPARLRAHQGRATASLDLAEAGGRPAAPAGLRRRSVSAWCSTAWSSARTAGGASPIRSRPRSPKARAAAIVDLSGAPRCIG